MWPNPQKTANLVTFNTSNGMVSSAINDKFDEYKLSIVLVYLLLTLNIFRTLFKCLYC